ncbi:hypothetical protein [Planobispora takensis]|uniref:Uncharacterized protein n=1 Tax=Planobispora takensis TaxID=1367882 RepID=A0A8J3WTS0_9ACTN|nr:hypothetical protein [Planobispora takensis]GIH99181.1 hypothetical protein Pta02_11900 [Planobispora takensis]
MVTSGCGIGDLTVSGGGRVMRVIAIDDAGPDTVTLVPDADPGGDREYSRTIFLVPLPRDAETITCHGCLKNTHLWIDATQTNRSSGARMRLIRCSRCFADAQRVRDCEIHAHSSTVRPADLEPRGWF